MPPRKTKQERDLEKRADAVFYRLASHVEFDVFDLSKVSSAIRDAGRTGQDMEAAAKEAIQKYRKN